MATTGGASDDRAHRGGGGHRQDPLLAEALDAARARGLQVVTGRAQELDRARPFGVLADAATAAPPLGQISSRTQLAAETARRLEPPENL